MNEKNLIARLSARLHKRIDALRRGWAALPPVRRFADRRRSNRAREDVSWHPDTETGAEAYGQTRSAFALTGAFWWYAVLMVAALLFTQILRSRASSIFFCFAALTPPVLLIYTLIARAVLHATLEKAVGEVEKLQPYDYEIVISNDSPLAFPFVDAILSLPREDAIRTEEKLVRLSMAPKATYRVNNTIRFRFRGTYLVGVRCFYVYDFFRLFRVRVDVDCYEEIYVMPRKRIGQGSDAVAVADMTTKTTKSPYTYERLEISDIRDYRLGDSLKSVHWKLSSKSEELVVRDYSSGASDLSIVFCDMAAHFPTKAPRGVFAAAAAGEERVASDEERRRRRRSRMLRTEYENRVSDADMRTEATDDPNVRAIADEEIAEKSRRHLRAAQGREAGRRDLYGETSADRAAVPDRRETWLAEPRFYEDMNEYCADGVIELTVSTVLRELRSGNKCELVWFDGRVEGGVVAVELASEQDFEQIFRLFATAPLCRPEQRVSALRTMMADTQSIKQLFVVPAPDEQTIAHFSELGELNDGSTQGAVELICYEPTERFAHPQLRRSFLENGRALLAARGIRLSLSHGVDERQTFEASTAQTKEVSA